jgi:putative ABC transport system ATP-binding protein
MAAPVVALHGLKRRFATGASEVIALRGVDLTVERGEMVAIMGASGSGKSTLLNLLGCLDRPSEGRYELDGTDVSRLSDDALSDIRNEKIGFVFQGFNLLARTSALDNVLLPLLYDRRHRVAQPRAAAIAALEQVGLGGRLDHHPNQLSGGQQQRVAVARALVTRPALLLADEPTGNLDTVTTIEVMALFQSVHAAGATLIIVTHEDEVASFCTRTVVLRDGLISRDEAHAARVAGGSP